MTATEGPWSAEWIDASFEREGKGLKMNYHIFDDAGNIVPKSEKLHRSTLITPKSRSISIDSWLKKSTPQGLPRKLTKKGTLTYHRPKEYRTATFATGHYAHFGCDESINYAGKWPALPRFAKQ